MKQKTKPKTQTNKKLETVINAIIEANGRIFSARFIKADGTSRTINCRVGVKKFLKGAGKSHPKHLLNVYDMNNKGYRYVNLDTLESAQIDGKQYFI